MKRIIIFMILILFICSLYACDKEAVLKDSSDGTNKFSEETNLLTEQKSMNLPYISLSLSLAEESDYFFIINLNGEYMVRCNGVEEKFMLNEEQQAEIIELVNGTPDVCIREPLYYMPPPQRYDDYARVFISSKALEEYMPELENWIENKPEIYRIARGSLDEEAYEARKLETPGFSKSEPLLKPENKGFVDLIRKIVELSPMPVLKNGETPKFMQYPFKYESELN